MRYNAIKNWHEMNLDGVYMYMVALIATIEFIVFLYVVYTL